MNTEQEIKTMNTVAQKLIWALYIHSCCVGWGKDARTKLIMAQNKNPGVSHVWACVNVDETQNGKLVVKADYLLGKMVKAYFSVDTHGNVVDLSVGRPNLEFQTWAWKFQSLEEAVNYSTYLPVDVDPFYLLDQEIQALIHHWETNKQATPLEDIGVLALGFTADEGINPATAESLVYYLTKYHMEKHGNREALLHIAEAGLN